MDTQRTIILLVFGMSLIMLWDGWQAYQGRGSILRAAVTTPAPPTANAQRETAPATAPSVGTAPGEVPAAPSAQAPQTAAGAVVSGERVHIPTDGMRADFYPPGAALGRRGPPKGAPRARWG